MSPGARGRPASALGSCALLGEKWVLCLSAGLVTWSPRLEAVPASPAWSHLFLFVLRRLGQHGTGDAFPLQKQDIKVQDLDYSVFKMLG